MGCPKQEERSALTVSVTCILLSMGWQNSSDPLGPGVYIIAIHLFSLLVVVSV